MSSYNGSSKKSKSLAELSVQCVDDSNRWFGDTTGMNVPHHALALAGEVGEFCNVVKKIERGSLSLEDASVRYSLAMELTDVLVYTLNLAGLLNIDLEKAYELVRTHNEKRFTTERAQRESKTTGRPVKDVPQA